MSFRCHADQITDLCRFNDRNCLSMRVGDCHADCFDGWYGTGGQNGDSDQKWRSLETASHIKNIAFDKTGTLTQGQPTVTDVIGDPKQVLTLAAALESLSEHPLAEAIVKAAQKQAITLPNVTKFLNRAGQGVTGQINGHQVLSGSLNWPDSRLIKNGRIKSNGSKQSARQRQRLGKMD